MVQEGSPYEFCGFGAITPELILRSLIGCIDSTRVLRVDLNSNVTVTSPVHCANAEDFLINLQRCLDMADDGYITLRVNVLRDTPGACDCGFAASWTDLLNSLFGEDAQGLVYLNVADTSFSPT